MTGTPKDSIRFSLRALACASLVFASAASLVVAVCAVPGFSKGQPIKDIATENAVVDYYNKALEFKRAGRLVHARILLEKAATADPTSLSAYVHQVLSSIYRELGNSNQAIREGLLSLKYDPSEKDTYYIVALCLKDARRYDESIQYLEHYAGMVSGKKKEDVLEMVRQLQVEKEKLGQFSPEAPDYLDQLQSEASCHKWRKSAIPLKVYIQPTSGCRGFNPVFPELAQKAFITWYQASSKKLSFEFVNDPSTANIRVVWTDQELRSGDDAAKERTKAGLTTSQCTEDGEVKEALIQVRTITSFTKKPEPEDRIKETCLHEAGHALGLNGHSTNNADIMYYGTNSKQLPALTKRDKATIARLYADFPAYPMVGVDTSFPYPSPDTDIPRLTNSRNGMSSPPALEGASATAGLLDTTGITGGGFGNGLGNGGSGTNAFGGSGLATAGSADSAGGGATATLPAPVQHMLVPPAKKDATTNKAAPPGKGAPPAKGAAAKGSSPTNKSTPPNKSPKSNDTPSLSGSPSDAASSQMAPFTPGQMMLQNNTIPNLGGPPIGSSGQIGTQQQMGSSMGAPMGMGAQLQVPMGSQMQAPMGSQIQAPMGSQMQAPMGSQMGAPMGSQLGAPMGAQMQVGAQMSSQMPMSSQMQMGAPMNQQMGAPMGSQMGMPMNQQMQSFPQQNYGQQSYGAPPYQNQGAMPNWNQQGPGSYAYGTPGVPTADGSGYNPYATGAPAASAPAATPQNPLQYAQQLFQQFTGGGGNVVGQPQLNQQPLGQGQQPMQMLNQVMQMFQPKQK